VGRTPPAAAHPHLPDRINAHGSDEMTQYILRRLALAIPLLLGITVITFVIINLAPGDPITALMNPEEMNVLSKEEIDARREALGLNQPMPVRYLIWLGQTARGNLGYSIQNRRPVTDMIVEKLPASMALSVTSIVLAIVLGSALGIISALRQYSLLDYALTVFAFFGLSVPGFFFALMGMFLFSVQLKWLPTFGMWTPGEPTEINLDLLRHAVLPIAALTITHIAGYMRYARAATLDARSGDYVTTARSKGLSERAVLWGHIFRNALLPLVTVVGLALPNLIGGSFIIETIFSWPGIGMLGYTAIQQRDYPVQMGIALMSAVAVLLANLATDITYAFVDPRIRYE
jgi:peptide/nickel transport system permease protein